MATFNPQVNYDRTPDTLNYSKGYKTGAQVAGEGLAAVAGIADDKIKATDRALAQMATDETRTAVNQTDASLLNTGPDVPSADPLDAEVRSQVRSLDAKKKAMTAGSLSPEHYYATVQAKVKEIRTRYAGYNETIDQELGRLGIDPNWQRKQILEAADKAKAAGAAQERELDRNNRELVEYALKNTMLNPEEQARLIPEGSWRDPKVLLLAKTRIAQQTSLKASLDFRRMEAESVDTDLKLKTKKAAEAYNGELQTQLASVVSRNVGFKQLQSSLDTLNKKVAQGETPTVEETTRLSGMLNLVKGEMEKIKLETKARYATLAPFIPEEMKKADQLFDDTLTGISDALVNQKTGLLSYHTNRLQGILSGKQLSIVQNSDAMSTLSGFKNLFGENITNAVASRNLEQARDAADAEFRNSAMLDLGTGKLRSVRSALAKSDKPEGFDGQSTKDLLNNLLGVMENPETLKEGRIAYMNAFYNEDNKGLWDLMFQGKNLSEDEKQAYYKRLTGPKVVERIKETGDINLINAYSDTVSYLSTNLNRATGNDLMAIRTHSTSTDVQWDAAKQQFSLVKRADPTVNPTYRFLNKIGAKIGEISGTEQQVVNRVNSSIAAVRNTADLLGLDQKVTVDQFLRGLGVDVNAPKQGGPLERLDQRNNKFIEEQRKKRAADDIRGGSGLAQLNDVTFTRDTLGDATSNTQGELTSRTPSTRDKVMEVLQKLGVPTEQASKAASAVENIVGPANTPTDAALAGLTVIPGGRLPGMAKSAGTAAVDVVKGGVSKIEELIQAVPKMTDKELFSTEKELLKEMKNLSSGDVEGMRNVVDRAHVVSTEKLNRATTSWDQTVKELAQEGPKTAQQWDAISSKQDAVAALSEKVVSLDKVRTAQIAEKVASDLDQESTKFMTKAMDDSNTRNKQVLALLTKFERNAARLSNLSNADPGLAKKMNVLLDEADKYALGSDMLTKNFNRLNEHGMVKGLRKIHDDLDSKLEESATKIKALAEEVLSKGTPKAVK